MDPNSDYETAATGATATTVSRRPMNAFLLFCKRHRGIVKERYPTLENRNITKILGEWWQSLSDDDKSTFTALANEYKEHVVREMPPSTASAVGSKLSNSKEQTAAAVDVTNGGGGNMNSASPSPEPPPPPPPPQPSHHRSTAEATPVAATEEASKNSFVHSSSSTSGSSSSASSIVSLSSSSSSAAPKPFKKRYLANFDTASLATASVATVSPEAEHACKALLQLAGVRESSPTTLGAAASATSASICPASATPTPPPLPAATGAAAAGRKCESEKPELKCQGSVSRNGSSRSGTTSPPEPSSTAEKERGKLTANGFRTLRDAVWSRVAKTLLKQEEEKGMLNQAGAGNDDAPLNLSSQCTIRGQTIIEHIIENCMQAKPANATPGGNFHEGGDEDASRSVGGNAILVNMNNNGMSGPSNGDSGAPSQRTAAMEDGSGADSPFSAEEIKERIYEGLKQDLLSKRSGEKRDSKEAAALWNMLPHIKIAQERAEGQSVATDSVTEPDGSNLTKSEERDDGSKLSIKHLLAQSPAPLSPRSRSGNSSSKSSAAVSPNAAASASASASSAASAVSVTLVSNDRSDNTGDSGGQPVNLSTTPPQTPSTTGSVVTISTMSATVAAPRAASSTTTSKRSFGPAAASQQPGLAAKRKLLGGVASATAVEEEEEMVRRSSRSCKGRLYQEFKDEGRLGRGKGGAAGNTVADRSIVLTTRKAHKSGDSPSATTLPIAEVAMNRKDQNTHSMNHNGNPPSPFDITAKLNAIPALSLDSYQQKLLKGKSGGAAAVSEETSSKNARPTTSQHQLQQPQPQARRRSGDNIESTPPKRKSRRTATTAAAAAMAAAPVVSPTSTAKKDAKEEQQLLTTVNVVVS